MAHANEKIAPTNHDYVPAPPAKDPLQGSGYVAKEYEHQEYPKYVGAVLVKNAEEEAAAKKAAAPAPETEDTEEVAAAPATKSVKLGK